MPESDSRREMYLVLPHRAIYDHSGRIASIRAVFRHAIDECFEFLQHDKRVIAISGSTLAIGLLFSWFWLGWRVTRADVIPGVLMTLIPTITLALGIYVRCLFKAPGQLRERRLWHQLQQAKTVTTGARRPRVIISAELANLFGNHWVTVFSILNTGDEVAVGIAGAFSFPYTKREVSFSVPRLAPGPAVEVMPVLKDEGVVFANQNAPLDTFTNEAWKEWVCGRNTAHAVEMYGGDEDAFTRGKEAVIARVGLDRGMVLGEPCRIPFDVTYSDFSGRVMYTTSHLFIYDARQEMRTRFDPMKISVSLVADRDPQRIVS